MTDTLDDIAQQSRERLLGWIIFVMGTDNLVELDEPLRIPPKEEGASVVWIYRVARDKADWLRCFFFTEDNPGCRPADRYWAFGDMSFDELYDVCARLEMQAGQ